MSQSIWYLLADAKGDPLPGTSVDLVELPDSSLIAHLKNAVWEKNKEADLKGVSPARLKVFNNKEATTALGPAKGVGALYDDPVTIAVPQTRCKLTHSCLLLTLTI